MGGGFGFYRVPARLGLKPQANQYPPLQGGQTPPPTRPSTTAPAVSHPPIAGLADGTLRDSDRTRPAPPAEAAPARADPERGRDGIADWPPIPHRSQRPGRQVPAPIPGRAHIRSHWEPASRTAERSRSSRRPAPALRPRSSHGASRREGP